jgi:hypothetical protein
MVRKTERLQSLRNDGGARLRILFEEFVNGALESVQLAGARAAHRRLHGSLQVLLHRARVHLQLARNAPQRPAIGLQVVNAVDLLDCQHEGFSLLSGRTGGCARGLLLFASLLTGSDPVIPGRNRVRGVMYDSWCRGRRQL